MPTKTVTIDKGKTELRLDADLGADLKTAKLQWRRVDTSRRYSKDGDAIGDPDYVANVKRQPLF